MLSFRCRFNAVQRLPDEVVELCQAKQAFHARSACEINWSRPQRGLDSDEKRTHLRRRTLKRFAEFNEELRKELLGFFSARLLSLRRELAQPREVCFHFLLLIGT